SITVMSPYCEMTLPPRSITTVNSASAFFKKSASTPSSVATSSMVRTGMAFMRRFAAAGARHVFAPSSRLRRTGTAGVALLAKLVQQNLRNGVQGGKNILPGTGDDLEALHPLLPVVQDVIEVIDRSDIWQIAFVVLQDVGDIVERHVLLGQVVLEIFETLDVLLHF